MKFIFQYHENCIFLVFLQTASQSGKVSNVHPLRLLSAKHVCGHKSFITLVELTNAKIWV